MIKYSISSSFTHLWVIINCYLYAIKYFFRWLSAVKLAAHIFLSNTKIKTVWEIVHFLPSSGCGRQHFPPALAEFSNHFHSTYTGSQSERETNRHLIWYTVCAMNAWASDKLGGLKNTHTHQVFFSYTTRQCTLGLLITDLQLACSAFTLSKWMNDSVWGLKKSSKQHLVKTLSLTDLNKWQKNG